MSWNLVRNLTRQERGTGGVTSSPSFHKSFVEVHFPPSVHGGTTHPTVVPRFPTTRSLSKQVVSVHEGTTVHSNVPRHVVTYSTCPRTTEPGKDPPWTVCIVLRLTPLQTEWTTLVLYNHRGREVRLPGREWRTKDTPQSGHHPVQRSISTEDLSCPDHYGDWNLNPKR